MFDAIAALTPGNGRRTLTPEERAGIEDVLDAAQAWAAGEMPFHVAAGFGDLERDGYPSPAYSRFVAVIFTPPADPRRAHLLALIDTLVTAEGFHVTRQGIYTTGEMHAHDAAVAWVRQHEDVA